MTSIEQDMATDANESLDLDKKLNNFFKGRVVRKDL